MAMYSRCFAYLVHVVSNLECWVLQPVAFLASEECSVMSFRCCAKVTTGRLDGSRSFAHNLASIVAEDGWQGLYGKKIARARMTRFSRNSCSDSPYCFLSETKGFARQLSGFIQIVPLIMPRFAANLRIVASSGVHYLAFTKVSRQAVLIVLRNQKGSYCFLEYSRSEQSGLYETVRL